jgi:hypothetical protein
MENCVSPQPEKPFDIQSNRLRNTHLLRVIAEIDVELLLKRLPEEILTVTA